MSHSYGAVRRNNGEIFHLEYNGTVDVCLSNLYKTEEEVSNNWRKQIWRQCGCNPINKEEVELAVTYGGGWYWKAFICPKCMVITDRFTPHDMSDNEEYNAEDGLPEWYPNREKILDYFR